MNNIKHESRVTEITILPVNSPIYSELATQIKIEDEAAGEFIVLKQEQGKISFTAEEWPLIRKEVNSMVKRLRNI